MPVVCRLVRRTVLREVPVDDPKGPLVDAWRVARGGSLSPADRPAVLRPPLLPLGPELQFRFSGGMRSLNDLARREKGTGTLCAQHRAPTEGWSGRSGKWCLSPFLTLAAGRRRNHNLYLLRKVLFRHSERSEKSSRPRHSAKIFRLAQNDRSSQHGFPQQKAIYAMATISESFAVAIQHHQAGRLQVAEHIYRQILQADPNHADAIHLLGLLAYQVGKHAIAVEYIGRAIRLNGNVAAFHNNMGEAYEALGKVPEAAACCRRALKLKPDYAEAHNNLGNALERAGEAGRSGRLLPPGGETQSGLCRGANNLGVALRGQGKLDEAVICCRRAVRVKPDYAEAHNNLGVALRDQGKLDEAVACYRRAVELRPDFAEAHGNLGNALKDQGKLDEAVACYRRALEVKPDFAERTTTWATR